MANWDAVSMGSTSSPQSDPAIQVDSSGWSTYAAPLPSGVQFAQPQPRVPFRSLNLSELHVMAGDGKDELVEPDDENVTMEDCDMGQEGLQTYEAALRGYQLEIMNAGVGNSVDFAHDRINSQACVDSFY
jgi:hypothetical protein